MFDFLSVEGFRFLLLGLGSGAITALAAQGIVVVYRGSGVLNFSHGAIALMGAATFVEFRGTLGTAGAFVVGVLLCAGLGALIHLLVMRRLRHASWLSRMVATLAILTTIQQAAVLIYGSRSEFVSPILPTWSWEPVAGASVGIDRMILLGIAAASTAVLWAAYRHTRFGMTVSAVAENQRAAAALGHSPDVIATVNWAIGAALAAAAGILVVPIVMLSVPQLTFMVIPALAAALVGGFRSFPLTLAGGLAIGVLQAEMTRYVSTPGWSSSVPFAVIIAVLVLRGNALPVRGHVLERLPALGNGAVRPVLTVAAIAALASTLGLFTGEWAEAMTTSMIGAVVYLSLVVITGYCGQLSLAQYAMAGVGAFIGGRLADVHDLPFVVCVAAAALGAVPVGLVLALPALRTRGLNLAVATLGLALAIEKLLLSNPSYTGGLAGTTVPEPELFGWSVFSIAHPERYALVCGATFVIAGLVVANVRRGRSGRRLIAVRSNERAAASLGIGVMGAKLFAFGLGGAIAAAGGALLAFRNPSINFGQFDVLRSVFAVVQTMIGGIGYVAGPFLGATLDKGGLSDAVIVHVGDLQRYLALASGLLLLLILFTNPSGFMHQHVLQGRRFLARTGRVPAPAPVATADVDAVHAVPPATLVVRGLTVHFGGVVALSDVDLEVKPGEVVGLIGPNGAGKTTLIDAVTGFTRPRAGEVRLNGHRVEGWSPGRLARAGLGRSFQGLELFEDLSVRDNLRAASDRRDALAYVTDLVWPGDPPLPPTAVAALYAFGLEGDLDRMPDDLPYGRRRLVGIARAVAASPSVLLLDEPAAGLDEHETAELGRLIRRLARDWGIAVLLVEHDVALVMSVCDRIVALDFGVRIAGGTPEEIRADAAVVAAYLGAPSGDDLASVAGDAGRDVR